MKCWKCHITMDKNEYLRTATCPRCGRCVHYRTKSEKRHSSYSGGSYGGDGCSILVTIVGLVVVFVIALPFLIVGHFFESSVGTAVGGVIGFVFNLVWTVVKFVLECIWGIISGLFNLIF